MHLRQWHRHHIQLGAAVGGGRFLTGDAFLGSQTAPMTPRSDLLVVVTAVSILLLAQSVALASATVCLTFDGASRAQDTSVVVCGFPTPTGSVDLLEIPVACDRRANRLLILLKQEPKLQALTLDNVCYVTFTNVSISTNHIILKSDMVTSQNYSRPVNVRLLASVSELVGITPTLVISGQRFSGINPSIFSAIGPTQKENLKYLVLSNLTIDSLDLSMLETLDIIDLLLVQNAQLISITNSKGVKLPKLKELVIWSGNKTLFDCRNFQALPANLTTIYLLQDGLKNNCALCYLPKGVNRVLVRQNLSSLPFYKSDRFEDLGVPFPLEKPYADAAVIPYTVFVRVFNVSQSTVSGCQACSCQPAYSSPNPSSSDKPVTTESTRSSGSDANKPVTTESSSMCGGRKDGSRMAPRAEAFAAVASAVLSVVWAFRL